MPCGTTMTAGTALLKTAIFGKIAPPRLEFRDNYAD
jgi:hypothetical protein